MPKVYDTETIDADPAVPATDIDLTPCRFGRDTFSNPCFWILVGVAGTLAVQYIFAKTTKS